MPCKWCGSMSFSFQFIQKNFQVPYTMKTFLFLQMTAEFQVPSPLVPTRENCFVRYCKHHPDGSWAVVDVSLDNLRPNPISKNRRRPSGCLIQELPNGYSKVTTLSLNVTFTLPLGNSFPINWVSSFFRSYGLSM